MPAWSSRISESWKAEVVGSKPAARQGPPPPAFAETREREKERERERERYTHDERGLLFLAVNLEELFVNL